MDDKHVLIVEDEAPIRDMIRFALERADFSVAEAEDAQSARLAMAERRPDLILMDWMLPGVSGAELARELRRDELTADVSIIMVTARVDEDDRVRGLNLGAQLHWMLQTDPDLRARTARIVTYAQYWGFRLTGVAGHADL